ncbi:hypothetical protein F1559_004458 [Cyanidiococcus yangmingshanensis]|uniref:Uncharacterized protein n=1 Tax=Cyanidiococcus yangmingshanensis TaxID=2690220 RepID=A0A7J7IQP3_9RHOD|nr:hypothetical protein F1559_004458 [Cyanidiococcus yangmingshanensis]
MITAFSTNGMHQDALLNKCTPHLSRNLRTSGSNQRRQSRRKPSTLPELLSEGAVINDRPLETIPPPRSNSILDNRLFHSPNFFLGHASESFKKGEFPLLRINLTK